MCLVQQEKFWSEIFEMKIIFIDPAECYNFRSIKKKPEIYKECLHNLICKPQGRKKVTSRG